jgi:hypothetical protein
MDKSILVGVAAMMLLMVQPAAADYLDDCQASCGKKLEQCFASIDKVNDIEIQDMKAACENTRSDCNHYCDDRGEDPYKEEKEKAAREQQEKGQGLKPIEFQFEK